jgi:hypothetical protein
MKNTESNYKLARLCHGYATLMGEITRRYEVIQSMVYGGQLTGAHITRCEIAGLNFRKIAELIIFANLIGHEEEYANLHPTYQSEWRLSQIIKRIKVINPNYYPKAVIYTEGTLPNGEQGIIIDNSPEGQWLSEDELVGMYNDCGDLLHARNPFQDAVDLDEFDAKFQMWSPKIEALLAQHQVALVDGVHQISCILSPPGSHEHSVEILQLREV